MLKWITSSSKMNLSFQQGACLCKYKEQFQLQFNITALLEITGA